MAFKSMNHDDEKIFYNSNCDDTEQVRKQLDGTHLTR